MHCPFCGAALEALPVKCPNCGSQPVLGERYEIRAVVGRGGMGEVFLGYDRRLANDVAIKRLTPQLAATPEMRDSLTKEARIMARLSDGAIVRLFDLAEFHGDLYLILEYVCGPSLRDMIRSGYRATPLDLARIMGEMCQGLTVAHNNGVIHRDLKPGNLLLALHGPERDGFLLSRQLPANLANADVKITDFGIAKAIADSGLTLTNAISGTPGYMAPEQFRGEKPSPETDIYALGAIACEMLTGKLPPRPLTSIPGVHPAVTEVVAKAMAPARQDRFPSAAAFYEALCNAIEGRSPWRPPLRPARPGITKPQIVVLAAVFTIGVTIIGLIAAVSERTPHRTNQVMQVPFQKESPISVEWHSPPLATELPPAVGSAPEGHLTPRSIDGPRDPKIEWSLTMPITGSMRVVALDRDRTVYVTGMMGEFCAIRDGKLLWGYRVGTFGASNVQIDREGRIWFHSMNTVYCLNRDGKGGRLPSGMKEPATQSEEEYHCVMNHSLMGRGWTLDLDADCTSAGAVSNPGGPIYVATDIPHILAVSTRGAVQWTYSPPCNPTRLIPTLPGQLVFACEDRSLHGLSGPAERWKLRTDGEMEQNPQVDRTGAIYYADYGKQTGISHVHSIDANGNPRWSVDLGAMSVNTMTMGDHGRLYVSGSSLYSRLVCLSDSSLSRR